VEHNYPAAATYLNILCPADKITELITWFKSVDIVQFKAKDIFRASQHPLLVVNNLPVEKEGQKILAGKNLSPWLLLRDPHNGKVVIADGYFRLCALYEFNEDVMILCKIV
jgi:hypothetical protein